MKKKIFGIAVSLIFALALAVAAAAAEKNSASEKIEGSFGYWSGFGASSHETGRIAPFEYEDGYFSRAPDIYDHDLAKMSLALSLCTYDLKELERVLSEIGFAQIEPNGYYAKSNKDAANTEPDNIGVAIASKKIGDLVMQELKGLDEIAYVRFAAVYRQFQDIMTFLEFVKTLEKEAKKVSSVS
jgi:hypothetical protein